jgi:chromosome segregation ATPase
VEFFHLVKAEIESLKESNEILQGKLNAVRFDLKSRDITVEDLKIKIAQLYVELESAKMGKKNIETDKNLLINEVELLSKDKQRYYSELVQVSMKRDSLQKNLDQIHLTLTEQEGYIQKLKNENNTFKNQVIETKMKALKEKEELVRHLESIEADIIARERALHKNEYEKLMLDKVQIITLEKEKYVKVIENLSNNFEQKTAMLNSLEQQINQFKNESNLYKTKYTNTQQESSYKTQENEKLKMKINEVF